ncbi:MAG: hypothetical protein VX197_09075, partial [Pseudomonadota bacterium]|nr:hypothetical protein [Pseudomonadota bacterium]
MRSQEKSQPVPNNIAQNDSAATLQALLCMDEFIDRHVGPDREQINEMLSLLGLTSLDKLIEKTIPESILLKKPMALADPLPE